jgi:hypothetical protein
VLKTVTRHTSRLVNKNIVCDSSTTALHSEFGSTPVSGTTNGARRHSNASALFANTASFRSWRIFRSRTFFVRQAQCALFPGRQRTTVSMMEMVDDYAGQPTFDLSFIKSVAFLSVVSSTKTPSIGFLTYLRALSPSWPIEFASCHVFLVVSRLPLS